MKQSVFITGLFLIIAILIFGGYLYHQKQNQLKKYHVPTYQSNLKITATPKYISPVKIDYKSGDQVKNFKFYLNYPTTWNVKIEEDLDIKNHDKETYGRFAFLLIPPEVVLNKGEIFWGGFYVDVYKAYPTIEEWFINLLKVSNFSGDTAWRQRSNYLYTTLKIGNKTAYYIDSSKDAPEFIREGFAPRYVILGTYYTYVIDFFQNGYSGFSQRIKADIFPVLKFD